MVISFLVFLVHFSKFFSGPLEKGSLVSNEEDSPSIYSFDKVPSRKLCLEYFSSFTEIFFLNFVFHIHLFDGVSLKDS